MKRTRLVVLVVSVALLLAMVLGSTALAVPPGTTSAVSGGWSWVNNSATVSDGPGGTMVFAGDEFGTWTGSFRGTSYDVFTMTFYPPLETAENPGVLGPAAGDLTATFKGKVGVNRGTMTMYFTIWEPANSYVMTGTWTILSGTKALKHVRGSGTWVSSGVDSTATYAGTITWK